MSWETLYCPNRSCCCYGMPFAKGRLVRNGSSHGTKQALCQACGRRIALSYGTAYYGLESPPMIFETAVRALAEGNSIQSTARIVQVDKDTSDPTVSKKGIFSRDSSMESHVSSPSERQSAGN